MQWQTHNLFAIKNGRDQKQSKWNRLKAIKNGIDQKIFLISINSAAATGVADQNGFNGRQLAPASFNAMNVAMTQAWQKAKCKFAQIYFSLLLLLEA